MPLHSVVVRPLPFRMVGECIHTENRVLPLRFLPAAEKRQVGKKTLVAPTDPLTFLGVAAVLAAAAFVACYLPSRLASRIDPNVALRVE